MAKRTKKSEQRECFKKEVYKCLDERLEEERQYFRKLYSRLEICFKPMDILIYHLKIFNNILNATSDAAVLQGEIFMKMYSTRKYVDRKIRKLLGKEFTEEEKTEIIYLFSEYIINGGKIDW